MKIAVSQKLVQLAKLFKKNGHKLYIVGGFVRNSILSIEKSDIDISGTMEVDKVYDMLNGSNYNCLVKNKMLGTAVIESDDFVCEYSTFRKEEYKGEGEHLPNKVEFVKSIEEDYIRRDFTINAIYFDILKGELIDPTNGLIDIKRKTIKTVCEPNETFKNDGLRILRLLRFSAELGFYIDSATLLGAIENKGKLLYISGTRKYGELKGILNSKEKYQKNYKKSYYVKTLQRFNTMRLWKAMLIPVEKVKISLVKKSPADIRFISLLIDIVNSVSPRDITMFLETLLGQDGYNFSKDEMEKTINIILGYYSAINYENNKDYFFKYFNNFKIISEIIKLKSKKIQKKYNFFYNYLISNKIAIQIKDLSIKGNDIKKRFPSIPQKRYPYILGELLSKVFDGVLENTKDSLLKEVERYDY